MSECATNRAACDDINRALKAGDHYAAGTHVAKAEGLYLLAGPPGTCRYNPLAYGGAGGGMGWHFTSLSGILALGINGDNVPELDPTKPNVVIYNDIEAGGVELAAVEWILPIFVDGRMYTGTTPPPLPANPPKLFGQDFHLRGPTSPGQDRNGFWNYQLHVWLWKPTGGQGLFPQWNPEAFCYGRPAP